MQRNMTQARIINKRRSRSQIQSQSVVSTSPKLLSCAQLLDSSDVASPVTAEKLSLTSGMDLQYVEDLHSNSMHLQSLQSSNEGSEYLSRMNQKFSIEFKGEEVEMGEERNGEVRNGEERV